MTDNIGQCTGKLKEHCQIHPGVVPHGIHHMDQVFGAYVSAGTRRKRASPQATKGCVKAADTRRKSGENIGQTHSTSVVKVTCYRKSGPALRYAGTKLLNRPGLGKP